MTRLAQSLGQNNRYKLPPSGLRGVYGTRERKHESRGARRLQPSTTHGTEPDAPPPHRSHAFGALVRSRQRRFVHDFPRPLRLLPPLGGAGPSLPCPRPLRPLRCRSFVLAQLRQDPLLVTTFARHLLLDATAGARGGVTALLVTMQPRQGGSTPRE